MHHAELCRREKFKSNQIKSNKNGIDIVEIIYF